MLPSFGRRKIHEYENPHATVHNYFEHLVHDQINSTLARAKKDREFAADVACVALNSLPPRYVRHDVDTAFSLSQEEQEEVRKKVADAVGEAAAHIEQSTRS